jgi:hypothetical protein
MVFQYPRSIHSRSKTSILSSIGRLSCAIAVSLTRIHPVLECLQLIAIYILKWPFQCIADALKRSRGSLQWKQLSLSKQFDRCHLLIHHLSLPTILSVDRFIHPQQVTLRPVCPAPKLNCECSAVNKEHHHSNPFDTGPTLPCPGSRNEVAEAF